MSAYATAKELSSQTTASTAVMMSQPLARGDSQAEAAECWEWTGTSMVVLMTAYYESRAFGLIVVGPLNRLSGSYSVLPPTEQEFFVGPLAVLSRKIVVVIGK